MNKITRFLLICYITFRWMLTAVVVAACMYGFFSCQSKHQKGQIVSLKLDSSKAQIVSVPEWWFGKSPEYTIRHKDKSGNICTAKVNDFEILDTLQNEKY